MPDKLAKLASDAVSGPIKQSFMSAFNALNHAVEGADLFGQYASIQKEKTRSLLQNVKLLGIAEPIQLTNIYYPTQISTSIARRLYKQEWHQATQQQMQQLSKSKKLYPKKHLPADEYFENHPKLVVLGGPGAGKTTFLKYLALAYSDEELRETTALNTPQTPFFVSLPHFSRQKTGTTIFEYIVAPIKEKSNEYAADFVRSCLDGNRGAVLLDSLDEVPASIRQGVMDQIRSFEQTFPKCRIALTCRTADYEDQLDSFCEVEIARLSKDAIQKIVKAWFADDKQSARELIKIIENDDGVAELTSTPLLLSLLCIQFGHDLNLPKRKVDLYGRCVDTLLRSWDATRKFKRETAYQELTDKHKERLFDNLACQMFLSKEAYEFDRVETIECVASIIEKMAVDPTKAEGILQEIECHHGIIEKFSQDEFCFSHTSIQDYFVARCLVGKRNAIDLVVGNLENENWTPVIEFMAALADDPADIINAIIKRSSMDNLSNYPAMARRTKILWLLYRCLAAAPFLNRDFFLHACKHLLDTQVQMARIYKQGGVFPIAELDSDGVRHPFLWRHKRPTLATALQPFRKFANEVLMSPIQAYSDLVIDYAKDLTKSTVSKDRFVVGIDTLAEQTLVISLVTPLARIRPKDVRAILVSLRDEQNASFIKDSLDRSITILDTKYVQQSNESYLS